MFNNTYSNSYFNKNKPFGKAEPDYSQMSLSEELEARFKQMEEAKQPQTMPSQPFVQPDYSKMSLREELEARFAEQERNQAAEQNRSIFSANPLSASSSLLGQPSSYAAAPTYASPKPKPVPQPQMLPPTVDSAWDKFKSVAEPAYVGTQGALTGAYDAGKEMVNQLYQGGESIGEIGAKIEKDYFQPRNAFNRYKHECSIPNVAYNLISTFTLPDHSEADNKPSVNPKHLLKILPKQTPSFIKDGLSLVGKGVDFYNKGFYGANVATNGYNALKEANCFNSIVNHQKGK